MFLLHTFLFGQNRKIDLYFSVMCVLIDSLTGVWDYSVMAK